MKKLINNMIEAGYLSHEDEKRFDAIDTIFDYVYKQIETDKNRSYTPLMIPHVRKLETDIWFTSMDGAGVPFCGHYYNNMYAYAIELLKYVGVGSFTPVAIDTGFSVGRLVANIYDDILSSGISEDDLVCGDEEYESDLPSPEEYCILLSHVLAKIVTDNVHAHGALMLYYHGQFIRLGLIDPPELMR